MFDTMVLTKAVAGICATLLLFLVGKWAADTIYMPAAGHGDEHHAAIYPVIEEDHGAEEEVAGDEPAVDILALYETADPAAGEALWRNCRACHKLDGTDGTGPHLNGVVGRPIDGVAGFNYSGALEVLGETWTVEALAHFLENPRENAPGTRMNFRGFSDPQDQVNMIAYLATTE